MFPGEASGSAAVEVEDDTSWILHLPELAVVVEFDCGGAGDLQTPDLIQVDQFGVEARYSASFVECDDGGFHVVVLLLSAFTRECPTAKIGR